MSLDQVSRSNQLTSVLERRVQVLFQLVAWLEFDEQRVLW